MYRYIVSTLVVLSLYACKPENPCDDGEVGYYYFVPDSLKPIMREWITKTITAANPKSDEEPEDYILQTQRTARRIFGVPRLGLRFQEYYDYYYIRYDNLSECQQSRFEPLLAISGSLEVDTTDIPVKPIFQTNRDSTMKTEGHTKLPVKSKKLLIKDMPLGIYGYTVPEAMYVDSLGNMYLNGYKTLKNAPENRVRLKVIKHKNGSVVVDVKLCSNYLWHYRDVLHTRLFPIKVDTLRTYENVDKHTESIPSFLLENSYYGDEGWEFRN